MHQTRQFTKRRPQSPLLNQQQQHSVDGLQIGVSKPTLPRSGLAIQSNAPIHASRSFSPKPLVEQHDHDHSVTPPVQQEIRHHTSTVNPYQPAVPQNGHIHQQEQVIHNHNHQHHTQGHDHHAVHNHGFHSNDHHGHDHHHHHHGHDHAQDHHHGHDHLHGHDHHHGHDHGHSHTSFPQVYTQPLPSYAVIFASLAPSQKALFTCFLGHIGIGMILWFMGAARESLAIVGYSYLVLFDAFGTLNNFVSSVLHLNPAFTAICTKRPFGSRRFEIVFALGNTIFLLFGTMFTTKESLEHLLLETHHEGDHHGKSSFPFGLLFLLLVSIAASVVSNVALKNHGNLVNLIKKVPAAHQEYSYHDAKGLSNMTGNNVIQSLLKNIYSLSIVTTGSIVFLVQLFGLTSPTFDKFLAFAESALMIYLGGPTAAALAKVLLQTMPDPMMHGVEQTMRLIRQQVPHVVSIDKVHFWQNGYGKFIGTLEIGVTPEAEEDAVIDASFDIMEPLVRENGGELTISVTKMQ